jgi:hypothetical protein
MMCCDLSEATECVPNEIEPTESGVCEHCPIVEKLADQGYLKQSLRILEAREIEDYEETLI